MLCQDGYAAGADLVGRIAVGSHPVAAHKAGLYPAVFHHQARHVVTDQGHVDPGFAKLIGGQPGSL